MSKDDVVIASLRVLADGVNLVCRFLESVESWLIGESNRMAERAWYGREGSE